MQPNSTQRVESVEAAFKKQFGAAPTVIMRAPGRVNLIGEHTDYNEGFVFPAAIDREMLIAASMRDDDQVHAHSLDYNETDVFSLSSIEKSAAHPWSDYLRGTLQTLKKHGHNLRGFNAVLSGNVPQGAGLSSSAAYEVAVASLMKETCKLSISGKDIALLSQEAENKFIGVQCGIMDQFISALGQPDSALFIDCKTLDYKSVPLNLSKHDMAIVITNSGVRRGLVDSQYNARRNECSEGVRLLSEMLGRRLNTLRDVTSEELFRHENKLPPVVAQRCRHVVTENERVLAAVDALQAGDLQKMGSLMNESHASLRDHFEVSCPELDALVTLTQKHSGVLGARMTGAGFGGCTVAIMKTASVSAFSANVVPQYEKQTGRKAEVYVCSAVGGAGPVPHLAHK